MRSCHIHVNIEQYKDMFFVYFSTDMALFLSLSTGLILQSGATRNRNLTISG